MSVVTSGGSATTMQWNLNLSLVIRTVMNWDHRDLGPREPYLWTNKHKDTATTSVIGSTWAMGKELFHYVRVTNCSAQMGLLLLHRLTSN